MVDEDEETIKVVLVGEAGTGKTTIMSTFYYQTEEEWEEEEKKKKEEEKAKEKEEEKKNQDKNNILKTLNNNENKDNEQYMCSTYTKHSLFFNDYNKSLNFEIWDSALQAKYRALNMMFFKDAAAIVIVYDITNYSSFEEIKNYWEEIVKESCSSQTILAIVGNKCHLVEREEVNEEEAREYAKSINALFALVSTRYVDLVNDLFYTIGKIYLKGDIIYSPLMKTEKKPRKVSSLPASLSSEPTIIGKNNYNKLLKI